MMPIGAVVQRPCYSHPRMIFNSQAALSLAAMQSNMEGKTDISRIMADLESIGGQTLAKEKNEKKKEKEKEKENISVGDRLDAVLGDDVEQEMNNNNNSRKSSRRKRKRYHRHTQQQTQELEALFRECPHPDENQRTELSQRLGLERRQVKFWFQNRRTQLKTQLWRHENEYLKKDNESLSDRNNVLKVEMSNPRCDNCCGPTRIPDGLSENLQLKLENVRLRAEVRRISFILQKYPHKSVSALASTLATNLPNSSLELVVGGNGFGGYGSDLHPPFYPVDDHDYVMGVSGTSLMDPSSTLPPQLSSSMSHFCGLDRPDDKSVLNLALAAREEVEKMARGGERLWYGGYDNVQESLNYDVYSTAFPQLIGMNPAEFTTAGTRDNATVSVNSLALVQTLMDADSWKDMFPGIVASASTTCIIYRGGVEGPWDGALQLMHAELQVLSPLVHPWEVNFLRFSKQIEGIWFVVDVSIDASHEILSGSGVSTMKCRRLPSGCIFYDLPTGGSMITWVEHCQYDLSLVHPLYKQLMRSGMALGAHRWLATLRRCESLAIASSIPTQNPAITSDGMKNMLTLAQRMMHNFCSGVVVPSFSKKWMAFAEDNNIVDNVRVMRRIEEHGESPVLVLSAATSVGLPVSFQQVFDYLRDGTLRSEWDFLSDCQPMQVIHHFPIGQDHGNSVSLLGANAEMVNDNFMSNMILQETWSDSLGSMVVYSPVNPQEIQLVMHGHDSYDLELLPSGFFVTPNGTHTCGSLMTVAFQIVVDPTAQFTVETVRNLIVNTVDKIRKALQYNQLIS